MTQSPSIDPVSWRVSPEGAGERLDRHVASRLGTPRSRVARWIGEGRIEIGGRPIQRSSHRVQSGDEILCHPAPIQQEGRVEAEPGDLEVLFEDEHLVVVNKAADTVVHPGAGVHQGTLANFLLDRYPEMGAVGGPGRPGIVHRLDRGTTGVLVCARTPLAYESLSRSFAERRVVKRYLCIVFGSPRPSAARIEAPLARDSGDRKRMAVHSGGRSAVTSYRALATSEGVAFLEVDLATGRTHQIRVHLAACHHPLVGDSTYGGARWKDLGGARRSAARSFPRPALHAWRLLLAHPVTDLPLRCEAPLPEDLRLLWRSLTGIEPPSPPVDDDWPRRQLPLREPGARRHT